MLFLHIVHLGADSACGVWVPCVFQLHTCACAPARTAPVRTHAYPHACKQSRVLQARTYSWSVHGRIARRGECVSKPQNGSQSCLMHKETILADKIYGTTVACVCMSIRPNVAGGWLPAPLCSPRPSCVHRRAPRPTTSKQPQHGREALPRFWYECTTRMLVAWRGTELTSHGCSAGSRSSHAGCSPNEVATKARM